MSSDLHDIQPDGERRGRARSGRAAPQPGRLPARGSRTYRQPCGLRAWHMRRLHGARRRRHRARLPDASRAMRRRSGGDHRGRVGFWRDLRRPATGPPSSGAMPCNAASARPACCSPRRNCSAPACRPARRSASTSRATTAAVPAIRRSSTRSRPWRAIGKEASREDRRRRAVGLERARPPQFLYRPFGAAAQSGPPHDRPRAIRQRRRAAAHDACRLRALAARPCTHRLDRHQRRQAVARRRGRRHRRRADARDDSLGRRADASRRLEIGPATSARGRARLLAGRSGLRRRGAHAGRGRGCLRARRGRLRRELAAVTDAETALDSATPVIHPDLGDNLCFERKLDAERGGQGAGRGADIRRRDHLRVRPPHRRHQRGRAPSWPTGIPASSAWPCITAPRRRT